MSVREVVGAVLAFAFVVYIMHVPESLPFDVVTLHNGSARARISVYGAHVLSLVLGGQEVLFVSSKAVYERGKAIRCVCLCCPLNIGPCCASDVCGVAAVAGFRSYGRSSAIAARSQATDSPVSLIGVSPARTMRGSFSSLKTVKRRGSCGRLSSSRATQSSCCPTRCACNSKVRACMLCVCVVLCRICSALFNA